ncbi:MAG: choice-of-anchor V domain-containing protein [Pseudomonadota bacterium]
MAIAALVISRGAVSYPEGAPWGAADHQAADDCASCHWEREPITNSDAITLAGTAESTPASTVHSLTLSFQPDEMTVSGFQILAVNEYGLAGRFDTSDNTIEVHDDQSALRSTAVRRPDEANVEWKFQWVAPDVAGQTVRLLVAVSAANDDQSPFGDQIHYRSFEIGIVDKESN